MAFTLINKKIFICCLGIVLITLLCYVIFNHFNRVREPLPPFFFPFEVSLPQMMIQIPSFIQQIIKTVLDKIMQAKDAILATTRHTANMAKQQSNKVAINAKATAHHIASKAERKSISIKQELSATAKAIKNKKGQIVQSVKQRARDAKKDAIESITTTKGIRRAFSFFRKYWKYFAALFLFLSKVGQWCIKNVQTLIYRIASFKNCFLWYFLEIIGCIIYIPIEFLVWLFCAGDFEKMFWSIIKDIDCYFNDLTGFHFFYYSDAVLQKCYSRKFVPFPPMHFPTSLEDMQKEGGKFILDFLLPLSPEELAEATKAGAKAAKDLGKELVEEMPSFPVM